MCHVITNTVFCSKLIQQTLFGVKFDCDALILVLFVLESLHSLARGINIGLNQVKTHSHVQFITCLKLSNAARIIPCPPFSRQIAAKSSSTSALVRSFLWTRLSAIELMA